MSARDLLMRKTNALLHYINLLAQKIISIFLFIKAETEIKEKKNTDGENK